jgi:hypothetical protein
VSSAQLLILDGAARAISDSSAYYITTVANYHDWLTGCEEGCGLETAVYQRSAAQRVEHFRALGLHARPQAGG